jgi:hypothetical protein
MKKVWDCPQLQMLGDVQTLTQQQAPCDPAVSKGHGTGDTLANAENTGCIDGASGF